MSPGGPGARPFPGSRLLDYPDQGFRLHQVEGDWGAEALALGDDSLGDVPDDGGLDQAGLGVVGFRPRLACPRVIARSLRWSPQEGW